MSLAGISFAKAYETLVLNTITVTSKSDTNLLTLLFIITSVFKIKCNITFRTLTHKKSIYYILPPPMLFVNYSKERNSLYTILHLGLHLWFSNITRYKIHKSVLIVSIHYIFPVTVLVPHNLHV